MPGQTGTVYVVSQGREIGRNGEVFVRVFDCGRGIEIGSRAVTATERRMTLWPV